MAPFLRGVLSASVVVALVLGWTSAASAEELAIRWSLAEFPTQKGQSVTIGGHLAGLTDPDSPEPPEVIVERQNAEGWEPVAVTLAGSDFHAVVPGETATYRAHLVIAGQTYEAGTTRVVAKKAASQLIISIRSAAVDYTVVPVAVRWRRTHDQAGLTGTVSLEFRRQGSKSWRPYRQIKVTEGTARITIKPRTDGSFRLRWPGSDRVAAQLSASKPFNNKPPGKVVVLPKKAPRPSVRLPAQARAERIAADAKVGKISAKVWKSMKGRSWHSGCPVGRPDLRLVTVSYWAFDGYVRRGEIVVHKGAAKRTSKIFSDLFKIGTPIRSIYRVDRFGWSKKLKGADDIASMKADNTSGFNCRQVVGRPRFRSPHATGKAIDINPWENPYRVSGRYWPNKSWAARSKPASITWRGKGDPVVKIFKKHGFKWLGASDLHHFQD